MSKGKIIFVAIAAAGLMAWQVEHVSAQDAQSKTESSVQAQRADQAQDTAPMRRGYPGYRLRKADEMPRNTAAQSRRAEKINLLMEEERKQLKTLSADRSLTKEQKKEKFVQIRAATHDKLKALLSPEEQKKYEESQSKSRAFQEALRRKTAEKSQQ
ncbi:MAG TPA: hypothetical protein VI298_08140 [Geobacteraceae bacterium]